MSRATFNSHGRIKIPMQRQQQQSETSLSDCHLPWHRKGSKEWKIIAHLLFLKKLIWEVSISEKS